MFDEQRLGNDGTEASRPCKPDDGDNQMKKKDEDIAHPAIVSKPEKHLILALNRPIFRHFLGCVDLLQL